MALEQAGDEHAELAENQHGDQLEEGGHDVGAGQQQRQPDEGNDRVAAVPAQLTCTHDPCAGEPNDGNRDLKEQPGCQQRQQDEPVVGSSATRRSPGLKAGVMKA